MKKYGKKIAAAIAMAALCTNLGMPVSASADTMCTYARHSYTEQINVDVVETTHTYVTCKEDTCPHHTLTCNIVRTITTTYDLCEICGTTTNVKTVTSEIHSDPCHLYN